LDGLNVQGLRCTKQSNLAFKGWVDGGARQGYVISLNQEAILAEVVFLCAVCFAHRARAHGLAALKLLFGRRLNFGAPQAPQVTRIFTLPEQATKVSKVKIEAAGGGIGAGSAWGLAPPLLAWPKDAAEK
jgi:hypothetical protein